MRSSAWHGRCSDRPRGLKLALGRSVEHLGQRVRKPEEARFECALLSEAIEDLVGLLELSHGLWLLSVLELSMAEPDECNGEFAGHDCICRVRVEAGSRDRHRTFEQFCCARCSRHRSNGHGEGPAEPTMHALQTPNIRVRESSTGITGTVPSRAGTYRSISPGAGRCSQASCPFKALAYGAESLCR